MCEVRRKKKLIIDRMNWFFNQVLFATFEKEAETSGSERLLLTAAVAAAKVNIDKAYEVDKLVPYV